MKSGSYMFDQFPRETSLGLWFEFNLPRCADQCQRVLVRIETEFSLVDAIRRNHIDMLFL